MSTDIETPDIQQFLQLLRKLAVEKENFKWIGDVETEALYANMYPDEYNPGCHRIAGFDDSGRRVVGTARFADPQSESVQTADSQPALLLERGIDHAQPEDIVQDEGARTDDRVACLNEWVILCNESASRFILDELARDDLSDEWLSAVVFAAEDVRFEGEQQQRIAADRLRSIAITNRKRNDLVSEQVVLSAIRRFASLVPAENADRLTEFLVNDGEIETRLVAAQGVVHIFEERPPERDDCNSSLRDRLFEIANKLLDPDVIIAGETSAIAEVTVVALAAMGDKRYRLCVEKAKELRMPWFSEIVRRHLTALRESWLACEEDVRNSNEYRQLSQILMQWQAPHESP